jgi:hypothetical protein
MRCGNCNAEVMNGASQCNQCGRPLYQPQPYQQPQQNITQQPKGLNQLMVVVAMIIVIAVIVGAMAFVVLQQTSNEGGNDGGNGEGLPTSETERCTVSATIDYWSPYITPSEKTLYSNLGNIAYFDINEVEVINGGINWVKTTGESHADATLEINEDENYVRFNATVYYTTDQYGRSAYFNIICQLQDSEGHAIDTIYMDNYLPSGDTLP